MYIYFCLGILILLVIESSRNQKNYKYTNLYSRKQNIVAKIIEQEVG